MVPRSCWWREDGAMHVQCFPGTNRGMLKGYFSWLALRKMGSLFERVPWKSGWVREPKHRWRERGRLQWVCLAFCLSWPRPENLLLGLVPVDSTISSALGVLPCCQPGEWLHFVFSHSTPEYPSSGRQGEESQPIPFPLSQPIEACSANHTEHLAW